MKSVLSYEVGEWEHLSPDLEFREPRGDQAALIYRFLLKIFSTLNEDSRNVLQNEIDRVFGPDIEAPLDVDDALDNIFQCLTEPSADSHHDLLPPVGTERPGPDDHFTDELVFLPNRVQLVCKFLDDLVSTYTPQCICSIKYRIYTVFGKPINVNKPINVFTVRNIVSRIVEALNEDLR